MGAATLAQKLDCSPREAERFIQLYFASYPELHCWLLSASNHGRDCGYVINPLGLVLFVQESNAKGASNAASTERKAANALVQSTSAHMCKAALVALDEALEQLDAEYPGEPPGLLGPPVHDEINIYVPGEWPITAREVIPKGRSEHHLVYEGAPLDFTPVNAQQARAQRYARTAHQIMEGVMSQMLTPHIRPVYPDQPGVTFPAKVDSKVNFYWEH